MKYKVGDKVKLKSKEGLDKLKQQHENLFIPLVLYEKAGSVCTIRSIYDGFYSFEEMPTFWAEPLIEGLAEEENKDMGEELRKCKSDFKYWVDNYIILPDGYVFKDENGNLIYANKIILEKKKKEYPKTYKEAFDMLGYRCDHIMITNPPKDASQITKQEQRFMLLTIQFQKLLICRDAYWKIAGEEMGLGEPWELSIGTPIYYIYYNRTVGTIKNDYADDIQGNIILAFPTAEIRDAFYENFKELIEQCKELL